jgi:hypothetical protein
MSKYMQMRIRILPYYKKGLIGAFPRIANRLSFVNKEWAEEGPSLFEIVGGLDKLLYELEGNPPFREVLLQHRSKLHGLYEKIEGNIADWHLAKADQSLYEIEDIFDEIERELGKI